MENMKTLWVIGAVALLAIVAAADSCDFQGARLDCGYLGIGESECRSQGCCWNPSTWGSSEPWCFHPPSNVPGYQVVATSKLTNGYRYTLELIGPTETQYGPDVTSLFADVLFETKDRIHFKIFDAKNTRWEVPQWLLPTPDSDSVEEDLANYKFSYTAKPFSVTVTRKSDGAVLFDSNTPRSLIFKDQFLEISNKIPANANIYGLGERVHALRLDPRNVMYTMFSIDTPTPTDENLYGVHNFYVELRGGKAHGVFAKNSNAQEVFVSSDKLTYYFTGGVLDFYVFVGPEPESVAKQYHAVIGKPHMPPYWSLGWHQCRYGFRDLNDIKTVVQKYAANGIPLDTIWADIDYMDKYKDFTWDPVNFPLADVKKYIDYLHNKGQHIVTIVDPGIHNVDGYGSWERGKQQDIFIKNAKGDIFIGKVWPGSTGFPDFLNPKTTDYWTNEIAQFLNDTPLDGIWIDMNECSNFCSGECNQPPSTSKENNPPYKINNGGNKQALNTKTIDMDALHHGGVTEYNAHSLYGFSEGVATRKALESYYGKRSFVLSRSTFAGAGKHVAHWLGDNHSTWQSMRDSIPGALIMNVFGIPLVGADICGFTDTANEQLCARWHAMGAFYPFARNHNANDQPDQYPYNWDSVKTVTKKALTARYSILPYYYTLFYLANKNGGTVMRPLFFEFPQDSNTVFLDQQFFIGDTLLFSPNLVENKATVSAYFPSAVWYDFWTYRRQWNVGWNDLPAPLDSIPVHIRGGKVLPRQAPGLTTTESRKNPFEIVFALDFDEKASGLLYLDDGDELDIGAHSTLVQFAATADGLTSEVLSNTWSGASALYIEKISVLGVYTKPKTVSLDGSVVPFNYDTQGILTIPNLKIPVNSKWSVSFANSA